MHFQLKMVNSYISEALKKLTPITILIKETQLIAINGTKNKIANSTAFYTS